jgi:hypothetical protein
MHQIQFASMTMVIQMKLMKAPSKMKNMGNKEFQLNMESKLISGLKMKMQKIQFVSLMMVIQMKLTKVNNNMKNIMNKEFQLNMESQLI